MQITARTQNPLSSKDEPTQMKSAAQISTQLTKSWVALSWMEIWTAFLPSALSLVGWPTATQNNKMTTMTLVSYRPN